LHLMLRKPLKRGIKERMAKSMTEYVKIYCCGDCGYYDWKKHKCKRGAKDDDGSRFFRDCPIGIHEEKDGDTDGV
jgi:hypothetical protein